MRKKLSSAVRGIRKQLSSKPGKGGTLQDESEAPSPEDGVVAQLHTVMDSEQGRDVDMTVVQEKISVADVAERVSKFIFYNILTFGLCQTDPFHRDALKMTSMRTMMRKRRKNAPSKTVRQRKIQPQAKQKKRKTTVEV